MPDTGWEAAITLDADGHPAFADRSRRRHLPHLLYNAWVNTTSSRKIVIIGAGGHGRVLLDSIRMSRACVVVAFVDTDPAKHGLAFDGVPILGADSALATLGPPAAIELANGLGGIRPDAARRRVFDRFYAAGYAFCTVIHRSATVARDVGLGEGAQVMAGAVVQTGASLGRNCLINTGALVDHDCVVGDHVHVAPGVVLSGGVVVEPGAHIGTGATVVQGVRIGAGALVAAGAVVVRSVDRGATVLGVPARSRTY